MREKVREVLPHLKPGAAAPLYLNGSVARSLAAACMEDLIPCLLGAGGASKDVNLAVPAELLNCSCVEVYAYALGSDYYLYSLALNSRRLASIRSSIQLFTSASNHPTERLPRDIGLGKKPLEICS